MTGPPQANPANATRIILRRFFHWLKKEGEEMGRGGNESVRK